MKITIIEKKTDNKSVKILLNDNLPVSRIVRENKTELLEIKTPKKESMNRRKWIVLVRSIIQEAKKNRIEKIEIDWRELTDFNDLGEDLSQLFAEAVYMADYEFRKYKSKPEEGWFDLKEIFVTVSNKDKTFSKAKLSEGIIIAKSVNFCRDLANTPGEDMTPVHLVNLTRKAIKGKKIKMSVLDEKQMRRKKMNGVLSVGKGSSYQSRFIILQYQGQDIKKDPIVLVGKGVTFDSGGLDTKPHPAGLDMKMDMSGGAAVIAAILAAENLKLKKNIVALIPAVENMPSGDSMRPGDIIRMMDGTNVEIGHTDAEGRLILADALTFAKSFKPEYVIDVATLTGAAMVALGERASAFFTDNEDLSQKVGALSEKTGDYMWRLPLWDEYAQEIESTHGDIANIRTKGSAGVGGAITAALFLKHFARDYKNIWMHIDIAPKMTAVFDEQLAKGAIGSPVRLLIELIRINK